MPGYPGPGGGAVRGLAADRGALPGPAAVHRQPGGDRAAARARAHGAPAAAGLAAGPPGRGRGCHAGRARGSVRRRRRPAGVAVGDVAGDRRPAARARAAADRGRAAATRGAAAEAKSLTATERDETARAQWRTQMGEVDPARLVFVDECGTHTSMTRRRARAVRGGRARGAVPRNRGPVTTLIAGVSLARKGPGVAGGGGTDTAVFATYLEHFLLPSLRPGQVVVWTTWVRTSPTGSASWSSPPVVSWCSCPPT